MVDTLKTCWSTMPDLRFGQLVQNILIHYKGAGNLVSDLWNMEEVEWMRAIQAFSDHHNHNSNSNSNSNSKLIDPSN